MPDADPSGLWSEGGVLPPRRQRRAAACVALKGQLYAIQSQLILLHMLKCQEKGNQTYRTRMREYIIYPEEERGISAAALQIN